MLRKPTIIALRARHTAFRIAADILWGRKIHIEPRPAPPPFAALADFDPNAVIRPRRGNLPALSWPMLGVLFLVVVLFLLFVATAYTGFNGAIPPAPARPLNKRGGSMRNPHPRSSVFRFPA
jgi:hypothetical protein